METIDRDSGIPPWRQLRDNLRAAILAGEVRGKISARTLGQENDGMAIGTVNKALSSLRDEGLVESVPGWGWRVIYAPGDPHGAPAPEDGAP